MTPEAYTSVSSSCCHSTVKFGKYDRDAKDKAGRRIRGLVHCKDCLTTFDRDVNAAINIRTLFMHHMKTKSLTNILQRD